MSKEKPFCSVVCRVSLPAHPVWPRNVSQHALGNTNNKSTSEKEKSVSACLLVVNNLLFCFFSDIFFLYLNNIFNMFPSLYWLTVWLTTLTVCVLVYLLNFVFHVVDTHTVYIVVLVLKLHRNIYLICDI